MLVLSRKVGERIRIGDDIEVTVIAVNGARVRLGFTAPNSVAIHRAEIARQIHYESSPPCLEHQPLMS